MTVFTTIKGRHRARPWWLIRPIFLPRLYRVRAMFTQSCKYKLPGEDWQDANKLFGVYGLSGDRHSFRIGWRWNPEGWIELCAYRHENGDIFINWFPIKIPVYREVLITLSFSKKGRVFVFVGNEIAREYSFEWNKVMFKHNVFFGGNNPAPQDVSIFIHQIK